MDGRVSFRLPSLHSRSVRQTRLSRNSHTKPVQTVDHKQDMDSQPGQLCTAETLTACIYTVGNVGGGWEGFSTSSRPDKGPIKRVDDSLPWQTPWYGEIREDVMAAHELGHRDKSSPSTTYCVRTRWANGKGPVPPLVLQPSSKSYRVHAMILDKREPGTDGGWRAYQPARSMCHRSAGKGGHVPVAVGISQPISPETLALETLRDKHICERVLQSRARCLNPGQS